MEKISHILPPSARVTSTDTNESQPMRPGMPTFGNPQGISTTMDRVTRTVSDSAPQLGREQLDWRQKDLKNAEIARTVSDSFFAKNQAPQRAVETEPVKVIAYAPRVEMDDDEDGGEIASYLDSGQSEALERFGKGNNLSIKA